MEPLDLNLLSPLLKRLYYKTRKLSKKWLYNFNSENQFRFTFVPSRRWVLPYIFYLDTLTVDVKETNGRIILGVHIDYDFDAFHEGALPMLHLDEETIIKDSDGKFNTTKFFRKNLRLSIQQLFADEKQKEQEAYKAEALEQAKRDELTDAYGGDYDAYHGNW